jgi:RNA polymerase sigma-70 factor (ECF subfamily)
VTEESAADVPIDDRAYVRGALAGDDRAFAVLVERHQRGLYNLAYRMVRNGETARDLVQDVFIRVHRSLGKYDPVYPFKSWIDRVASNLCIDYIRKRKLDTVSLDAPISVGDDDSVTRDLPDETFDPGRDLEDRERGALLSAALDQLPPAHRLVLSLRHRQDLSYDEIALALDVPLGTVKARIHRAREALRQILVRDYRLEDLE